MIPKLTLKDSDAVVAVAKRLGTRNPVRLSLVAFTEVLSNPYFFRSGEKYSV